jgi:hypothetical protein
MRVVERFIVYRHSIWLEQLRLRPLQPLSFFLRTGSPAKAGVFFLDLQKRQNLSHFIK